MKYLIKTTDASSLEHVEYDRVVFDSTVGRVIMKKSEKPQPTYEYVDLGLPSGLKWAKYNLGAESETDYGDYYQWGSTTPNTDTVCDWAHAPFNNGSSDYDSTYFASVKDTVCPDGILASQYDAASVNMGGNWRMPTKANLQELLDNTDNKWTTINGVNGRKFTSKTDSTKYIFIPASGYRDGSSFSGLGNFGGVWSSSLYSDGPNLAWELDFDSGDCGVYGDDRLYGFTVRPVSE